MKLNYIGLLLIIPFLTGCFAESCVDLTCNPFAPPSMEASVGMTAAGRDSTEAPEGENPFAPELSSELAENVFKRILIVKATAYNAVPEQTDSTPTICAWGDPVSPDVIAISRDLEALGLTRGKEVYVKGYGKKVVKDRMHYRKRNQIDLFMEEYDDAIQFGVRELEISWEADDTHGLDS